MDVTFLTEQQIWGDDRGNGQLQVMKGYGTKAGMSDLAIALGGLVRNDKTSDGQRSGPVWSASSDDDGNVRTVHYGGDRVIYGPDNRVLAARPALPSSVTSPIRTSVASSSKKNSGVDVVEYGEYPQTIAPEAVNKALEQAFKAGKLQATGKKYTFDSEGLYAYDQPFKAKEYEAYQHNGKRYIRFEAKPIDNHPVLSNGHTPELGEACWIEVQPIEWLVDPSGVWVARQALFSGVQFDKKQNYDGKFDKTDMKHYLDTYFSKEMLASRGIDTPAPPRVTHSGFGGRSGHATQARFGRPLSGDIITLVRTLKRRSPKSSALRRGRNA